MKYLVIPDIHLKIWRVEEILAKNPGYDKVVFLGDFFDDFNDTEEQIRNTTAWLKDNIHNPRFIFLWGNHDFHYYLPKICRCSGYADWKHIIINDSLSLADWEKFNFYHFLDKNTLCTHAGLDKSFVKSRKTSSINRFLINSAVAADDHFKNGVSHWFVKAGKARYGDQDKGGLLWLDYFGEFTPIPGLNQIFGHTPSKYGPELLMLGDNYNLNLDTHLNHYLIWEDGKYEIKEFQLSNP